MNEYQPLSSSEDTIITAEIVADPGSRDDDPLSPPTDWFHVSRRLQRQNQELLQTVLKLEHSLQQAQEQLKIHSRRAIMAEQQTQEKNQHQQQVNNLMQELESSRQKIAQQNSLLDRYSQEIKTARAKIAQLEKHQSELSEKQRESQEKLQTAEQHIRELRTRLQRQQRYTIQYKAALDQCLGKGGEQPASNVIPMVSVQPWSGSEALTHEPTGRATPEITPEIAVESTEIIESLPARNFSPSPKLTDWSARTPKQQHKSSRKIELPSFLS